jgi:DNA modification methylase
MIDLICGDALEELARLPDGSVNCGVTSPPYYGLRDYGTAKWEGGDPDCKHNPQKPDGGEWADRTLQHGEDGVYRTVCKCGALRIDNQIGLEETPEAYVAKLVAVFREFKRVLRDDGTCWVNLGDTYVGGGRGGNGDAITGRNKDASQIDRSKRNSTRWGGGNLPATDGLKPKDLMGIPWRVAFALQADGWWLRQDIIWNKPNPMPESVTDRCTKSHEYVFLLTKSARYFYDQEAVMELAAYDGRKDEQFKGSAKYKDSGQTFAENGHPRWKKNGDGDRVRNPRSVWTINTVTYQGAHFATFPPELPERCIKAGCPPGGVVLDPFMGSGTTGFVAVELGRSFIGIELNPKYVELARRRIEAARIPLGLDFTVLSSSADDVGVSS